MSGDGWKPVLAITNSRSFGTLRGLAMRARGKGRPTILRGTVRFGWNEAGVFQVEVLTGGDASGGGAWSPLAEVVEFRDGEPVRP